MPQGDPWTGTGADEPGEAARRRPAAALAAGRRRELGRGRREAGDGRHLAAPGHLPVHPGDASRAGAGRRPDQSGRPDLPGAGQLPDRCLPVPRPGHLYLRQAADLEREDHSADPGRPGRGACASRPRVAAAALVATHYLKDLTSGTAADVDRGGGYRRSGRPGRPAGACCRADLWPTSPAPTTGSTPCSACRSKRLPPATTEQARRARTDMALRPPRAVLPAGHRRHHARAVRR